MFFINYRILKRILRVPKKHKNCFLTFYLLMQVFPAFSEENIKLSDSWALQYGGVVNGNFRTAGENFQINQIPSQKVENQTTS